MVGICRFDHAVLAGDHRVPMEGNRETAGHLTEEAARELERGDEGTVNPARFPGRGRMNTRWPFSGDNPHKTDSIASSIEKCASAKAWNESHIWRARRIDTQVYGVEPEMGADQLQPSDSTLLQQLAQHQGLRLGKIRICLDQAHIVGPRRPEHGLRLRRVDRYRFFAKHMLPACHRTARPFSVKTVWKWKVNGVDVGIVQQCVVGSFEARDTHLTCRCERPEARPIADTDHVLACPVFERAAADGGDVAFS